MGHQAIMTKRKTVDASRPVGYVVGVKWEDGSINERWLTRFFWSYSTARRARASLQKNLDRGNS